MKVATGEMCQNRIIFKQLIMRGAIDVVQADSARQIDLNLRPLRELDVQLGHSADIMGRELQGDPGMADRDVRVVLRLFGDLGDRRLHGKAARRLADAGDLR